MYARAYVVRSYTHAHSLNPLNYQIVVVDIHLPGLKTRDRAYYKPELAPKVHYDRRDNSRCLIDSTQRLKVANIYRSVYGHLVLGIVSSISLDFRVR